MSQTKQQQKTSEFREEPSIKKKTDQMEGAIHDLPGVVKRVSTNPVKHPSDILTLQQTLGNRTVQRMLD